MLMYEALMHRLVRRHIAGAGFDPTMMARLSVLRDIHGKSRPHTGPCILRSPERPGHGCFHHQHVSWGTGCDMANSVVLVGLSGNGTCADNECVHLCNWEEYLASLWEMMPWLLIYDKTNDGRWLPHFWAMLSDLPAEQTQFVRSLNQCSATRTNPFLRTCGLRWPWTRATRWLGPID